MSILIMVLIAIAAIYNIFSLHINLYKKVQYNFDIHYTHKSSLYF